MLNRALLRRLVALSWLMGLLRLRNLDDRTSRLNWPLCLGLFVGLRLVVRLWLVVCLRLVVRLVGLLGRVRLFDRALLRRLVALRMAPSLGDRSCSKGWANLRSWLRLDMLRLLHSWMALRSGVRDDHRMRDQCGMRRDDCVGDHLGVGDEPSVSDKCSGVL